MRVMHPSTLPARFFCFITLMVSVAACGAAPPERASDDAPGVAPGPVTPKLYEDDGSGGGGGGTPQCPGGYTYATDVFYHQPYTPTIKAPRACVQIISQPTCVGVTTTEPWTGIVHQCPHHYVDYQSVYDWSPVVNRGQIEDVCEDPTNTNWIAWPDCGALDTIDLPGSDACGTVLPIGAVVYPPYCY
jgi:hypothetical protein